MKVTNNRIGSSSLGKTEGAASASKDMKTKGAKSIDAGQVKDSANVNVSDRAQMMQKAKDIASQPETIDEAKVARLQKLIDEGKYNVDAASIADRLVDEHMTIPD
jgi:flagellar biosynthesis anti-sigma factor FlgM